MKHDFEIKDSAGHSLGYQSAETAKEAVKLARIVLGVPALSATFTIMTLEGGLTASDPRSKIKSYQ